MGNAPSTALSTCLTNAVGGDTSLLALPNKLFYQQLDVKPYNQNFPVTPATITYPKSAEQVAKVVACAKAENLKVQARSGGHSYANYCLGGVDGAVVVDLKNFQSFSLDPSTLRATFGSGTLLGDLDKKLQNAGGRAISHGTCPQVGSGGHATIGGLGPTSRLWGSMLDHVEEVEVVLANSSVVRASTTQNPDLFFCLRGAGASFGIITEFTMRTEAAPGQAVQYSYTFDNGLDAKTLAAAFKGWQTLISDPNIPRKFASEFTVLPTGAVISGTFFGSEQEFDQLNTSSVFPDSFSLSKIVFKDFLALLVHWAEDAALQLGGGIASSFYSKNIAIPQGQSLSDSAVDSLFEWLASKGKGKIFFLIFDLTGGAISDVPIDSTSYRFRNTKYFSQGYVIGQATSDVKDFLGGITSIIQNNLPDQIPNPGSYPGYVDPYLFDAIDQYWSPNIGRLQQYKRIFDPSDVFHNPQSVPPRPLEPGED